ncbi:CASP C terminal-domain-containing protein [Vararia minispora EC-137]|uniref:CASP C terminal-domain-containing protein n=1 Tax=Vararia minispora EC-137 TaxID=1314806 RepID=A0ACB8QJ67_9AGAM|nr:CASP C terminal-domain-containing protein [Vararia minispora EC-137]
MDKLNFSAALTTWKSINLLELQKTLDTQGVELVENQKESVVGRKALADRTKDFKRIPEEEKLNAFKGLLKAYQTEIDSLTKRSKFAENAFLDLYKVLAEAPDPYPLLEAAVDHAVKAAEYREMEEEIQRLRRENVELQKRMDGFASVDAAKRKAETKVEQLEQKMENVVQERIAQKENELNAAYDEKMRNYEEREQDLQRQVAFAKEQLRDLRMSNESNHARLLDQSQRQGQSHTEDQEVYAKLAEMELVVADLERANTRVAAVERRNELLRAEVESLKTGNERSDRVKDLEAQVTTLENEIDRLSDVVDHQKAFIVELETKLKQTTDEHSQDVGAKNAEISQLKDNLKRYSDYDEVKRELDIMKLPNPNAYKANAQQASSLEALLAAKNKRILDELAKFRVLHNELEASLQHMRAELSVTSVELEKQRGLNERLENDLLMLDQRGRANGSTKQALDGRDSSEADALAGLSLGRRPKQEVDTAARSSPIPFTSSADTSILPIVTSQRDRFRQRNAELEEELRKQFQIISELRAEIRSLQADNLKLYEKVRYMQSYRENTTNSSLDPLPSTLTSAGDSTSEMNKYRARYEEAMNPFEAFRGREAARAYSNLNPLERAVFVLTRVILGNRRARTAFICYAIALHILVMYTTYGCTVSSTTHLEKQPTPFS